jgi:hypothetical protein
VIPVRIFGQLFRVSEVAKPNGNELIRVMIQSDHMETLGYALIDVPSLYIADSNLHSACFTHLMETNALISTVTFGADLLLHFVTLRI